MENISFIKIPDMLTGKEIEHAIIDWGDGNFTSMTKAEYDKEYPNGVNEASIK
jgi:hypothetical protein